MKKICVLILVILMTLTLLVGCSTAPDASAETEAAAEEETTDTAAEEETTDAATEEESEEDSEFDPSEYTIAGLLWPTSNPTVAIMAAGFMDKAKELGYNAILIGGDTDDSAVAFQMLDAAMAQYDNLVGIAMCPYEDTIWKKVKDVTDAGIAASLCWVSTDEETAKEDYNDLILGWYAPDAVAYGYAAGQAMGEACGGTGTVAITQSSFNQTEDSATEGFVSAITELYPDMTVLDPQVEGFDTATAISTNTAILQGNPDIVGVYGTTGTSAVTWAGAKKATGRDILIIGMDFSEANLDLLADGTIYALVAQPIYDAWGLCAVQIDAYLRGEETTFDNPIESPVIFKEDVDFYYDLISNITIYSGDISAE